MKFSRAAGQRRVFSMSPPFFRATLAVGFFLGIGVSSVLAQEGPPIGSALPMNPEARMAEANSTGGKGGNYAQVAPVVAPSMAQANEALPEGTAQFESLEELEAYIAEQEAELEANKKQLEAHRARLAEVQALLQEQQMSESDLASRLTVLCREMAMLGDSSTELCQDY